MIEAILVKDGVAGMNLYGVNITVNLVVEQKSELLDIVTSELETGAKGVCIQTDVENVLVTIMKQPTLVESIGVLIHELSHAVSRVLLTVNESAWNHYGNTDSHLEDEARSYGLEILTQGFINTLLIDNR